MHDAFTHSAGFSPVLDAVPATSAEIDRVSLREPQAVDRAAIFERFALSFQRHFP